jgi:hypothetical protein
MNCLKAYVIGMPFTAPITNCHRHLKSDVWSRLNTILNNKDKYAGNQARQRKFGTGQNSHAKPWDLL